MILMTQGPFCDKSSQYGGRDDYHQRGFYGCTHEDFPQGTSSNFPEMVADVCVEDLHCRFGHRNQRMMCKCVFVVFTWGCQM